MKPVKQVTPIPRMHLHFLPLSNSTEYEINFVNSTIYYISKETGEKKSFRYE